MWKWASQALGGAANAGSRPSSGCDWATDIIVSPYLSEQPEDPLHGQLTRYGRAANSSPPLVGRGWGGGRERRHIRAIPPDPPPQEGRESRRLGHGAASCRHSSP